MFAIVLRDLFRQSYGNLLYGLRWVFLLAVGIVWVLLNAIFGASLFNIVPATGAAFVWCLIDCIIALYLGYRGRS